MAVKSAPVIKKSPSLPTILIAGGAGFLGAGLAKKLIETRCRVVVADNLTTGRRSSISPLLSHPRFVFIESDINQKLPPEIESIDYIFQLAAHELYLTGRKDINWDAILTNALGTRNLLNLAKSSHARFILASTIDIYQGLVSSENLKNYFGATSQQERQFSHTEAKRFAEALVWEFFEKDKIDARIVRLGEIFGPQMDLNSSGTLGRLLSEILTSQDLTIYGEGLEKEYYTHIDDVIEGLIKAAFQKNTSGKIYSLTSLSPTTPLELVYLLKEISGRDLRVVFKPPLPVAALLETRIIDGESQGELGWQPKISLEEGLREVLAEKGITAPPPSIPEEEPSNNVPPKTKTAVGLFEKGQKHHLRPPEATPSPRWFSGRFRPLTLLSKARFVKIGAALALAASLWFLIYPTAGLIFNLYHSQKGLANLRQSAAGVNLEQAATQAEVLGKHLYTSNQHLERLSWLLTTLRKTNQKKTLKNLLNSATFFVSAVEHETKGLKPLVNTALNLTHKDGGKAQVPDTEQADDDLAKAQEEILLAEAYFKSIEAASFGKRLQEPASLLGESILRLKELNPIVRTLTDALPEIFGFDGPKTYLLVFQNSNELRPTGGFIGSYGKLVIKNGKIDQLLVDDVYNVDGVLEAKGIELEPPEPLKEHLGISLWLMRDANWDPDFTKSGEQIKTFYNLATGEEVAGVIALDLEVIKEVLGLTGPVYLAQFNESISTDNFFEKTEFYSEAGYFEGSPQKKAFLSLLSARLLEKVLKLEPENTAAAARILKKSLQERHLLIYYPHSNLAELAAEKYWDGGIKTSEGDYLMIVDANVGATKANYYVKRSLNYAVSNTDRQGTLEGELTVNYVHGAASNTWPGGAYKNYLRVYTPQGSTLKRVERSEEGVDRKALEITDEVTKSVENGKTVFGTVFTLDAGKSLRLTFTYELPPTINLGLSSQTYRLVAQKQPGTVADPLTIDFLTPFGHQVSKAPEGAKRVGNLWRYSGNLREDRELEFILD